MKTPLVVAFLILSLMSCYTYAMGPAETELFKAIDEEHIKHISSLLDKGVDVNCRNYGGDTPLLYAIYFNTSDMLVPIVRCLLDHGADVNTHGQYGNTPLIAIMGSRSHSFMDCIHILLDRGADVNARNTAGRTALMAAADHKRSVILDILDLLVSRGADINAKDNNGETALVIARRSFYGSQETARWLIDHGANWEQSK